MMTSKILVVDDDEALVELIRESLQSEGFTVMKGYNGRMALSLAQSFSPQLIIMDVNMPVQDGLEALRALRERDATYDIPVIFLTAVASKVIYPAVETTPRVTYLKKPVDLQELHSMVRYFLRSYPRIAHN